ncbi:MAG: hypothetical protein JWN98_955, partial [Abditibacteriota bacterium]|nr:hypothetical protein [Abditibacteriota bacterium]
MSTSSGNTQDSLLLNSKLQAGAFIAGKVLAQGGFGITYYGGDMKPKGSGGGGLLLLNDTEGFVTECEAIGNAFYGIGLRDGS